MSFLLDQGGEFYWNRGSEKLICQAGTALLEEVKKLDVFKDVLVDKELNWDNFRNKVKWGIIDRLDKVRNKRNSIVSNLGLNFNLDSTINKNLIESLLYDFQKVPPLSDFLHTSRNIEKNAEEQASEPYMYVDLLT